MESFYTYLHCKPGCVPFYVGKGCNGRSHDFTHHRSQHYRNVIAKYGAKNICVFVFPCATEAEAFECEIQQIAQLRREGYPLVNLTDGGDGVSGLKMSAESCAKMSIAQRGKTMPPDFGAKIAAALRGRKLSKEHCAKLSIAHMGKVPSVAQRIAMSLAQSGKTISPEHRAKLVAANTGKCMSAETRMKIAATLTGKTHSAVTKAKMSASQKNRPAEIRAKQSASLKATWAKRIQLAGGNHVRGA